MTNNIVLHPRFILCVVAMAGPIDNLWALEREYFGDFAKVLSVEPIIDPSVTEVDRFRCQKEKLKRLDTLWTAPIATSLAADIRQQARLYQPYLEQCRLNDLSNARNRTIGYKVIYRYQGKTHVRQMRYHPGRRLPVTVAIEPIL